MQKVISNYYHPGPDKGIRIWNIDFPNRIGLAAGFDKDGAYTRELASLGFGCIEIGTITPLAQSGNPKPRLFRIPDSNALINRMGFNNKGMDNALRNLSEIRNRNFVLGGNIGKNKDTPNEEAHTDYIKTWEVLYPWVDYFVINISSPNTPHLRELQEKEPLKLLLGKIKAETIRQHKTKPILVKISPDLSHGQLDDILEIILEIGMDGIVATNTTLSRAGIQESSTHDKETGGLSGAPLRNKSTEFIRYIHTYTNGKLPIIGVGGIFSAQDALEKIEAGASLVQLYTGFIFQGPGLIKEINKALMNQATA